MRISDWSSDVCSSDLHGRETDSHPAAVVDEAHALEAEQAHADIDHVQQEDAAGGGDHAELEVLGGAHQPAAVGHQQRGHGAEGEPVRLQRSEAHTTQLQSLMRISYADS